MTLPTSAASGYATSVTNGDKSAVDQRLQHRWTNTSGVARSVSVAWPSQSSLYMREAVVHVEDSAGAIQDTWVSNATGAQADCVLEIPNNGFIFVTGQRPRLWATSALTLTEIDLTDNGTPDGDALHPAMASLVSLAAIRMAAASALPTFSYSGLTGTGKDGPGTRHLLGYAEWILTVGQDATTGGHTASEYGGAWDSVRGWGYATGWADVLASMHALNLPGNPLFDQIEDRAAAMLLWECSRVLHNGMRYQRSTGFTGSMGLASSHSVPYRAVEALWSILSVSEQDALLNALRVVGHASLVQPLESSGNQSTHFLEIAASWVRVWDFVRNGEADQTEYDALFNSLFTLLTTHANFALGSLGDGFAFSDTYGVDRSYMGVQASNVRHAWRALPDRLSYKQDVLDLYDDLERFWDPMLGKTVQGDIICSNGISSRLWQSTQQYVPKTDMIGVSRYAARYFSVDTSLETPTATEPPDRSISVYVKLAEFDATPIAPLSEAPLPSSVPDFGTGGNGNARWYRTPRYFAGFSERTVWLGSSQVNGGSGGPSVGEAGEPGGPFSSSIEEDGGPFTSSYGANGGGVFSGQGALESLSINGRIVLRTLNISPLTVHGLYGSDGSRYYTSSPHNQSSTWDGSDLTLTTTFQLYGLTGTFTRVLDFSDPEVVSVSLTSPADPSAGTVTLTEVVPFVQGSGIGFAPLVAPNGFTKPDIAGFGLPSSEGDNIGRYIRVVPWDTTIVYALDTRVSGRRGFGRESRLRI